MKYCLAFFAINKAISLKIASIRNFKTLNQTYANVNNFLFQSNVSSSGKIIIKIYKIPIFGTGKFDNMNTLLNFKIHGDHSGKLVALEKGEEFPFEIRRIYYIWDTHKDVVRGKHAHRALEQVVVCTSGSCDFILDDGTNRETVHLNNPTQGLHIKHTIWREFTNFSKDCVVMVLASEHYDEADYIRDYETFLREIKNV